MEIIGILVINWHLSNYSGNQGISNSRPWYIKEVCNYGADYWLYSISGKGAEIFQSKTLSQTEAKIGLQA